jgi:hypothetical protein
VDAFRSYVPHFIDPHKPRPPDVTFREAVFGNKIFAGRPPTAVGDLYFDFGFWGVAVGAVLIAFGARALLELLAGSDAPGREFRVALYGVSLFVLYELISNGYAIAIGHFLTVVVPFLIAALVFGRIRSRAARAVDIQSSGEVRRAGREHALLKS